MIFLVARRHWAIPEVGKGQGRIPNVLYSQ